MSQKRLRRGSSHLTLLDSGGDDAGDVLGWFSVFIILIQFLLLAVSGPFIYRAYVRYLLLLPAAIAQSAQI